MRVRNKIALCLLYSVSFVCFLFAMAYLFRSGIMPYHERFLGYSQDLIEPKMLRLMVLAMRIIGGTVLSIGFTLAVLTMKLKSGEKWIKWTILMMMTVMLSIVEYVMLQVGLFTPWYVLIIGYVMICTGLYLYKTD